jgi:dihydrofolate reductase
MSVDGRLENGEGKQAAMWSSKEDQAWLTSLIAQYRFLVMGRTTYEAIHPVPQPGRLLLVLTKKPERFGASTVPGSLEFIQADNPDAVVRHLKKRGCEQLLLLGGASVYTAFLRAELVNELYLTVEPVVFGAGLSFIDATVDIRLQLIHTRQLNSRGTILLHYRVRQ